MLYDVHHRTVAHYAGAVQLARINVRLRPAAWPGQRLASYALAVEPKPALIEHDSGPFIVERERLALVEPIARLVIESRFRIELTPAPEPASGASLAEIRAAAVTSRDLGPLGPASYIHASAIARPVAAIAEWAAPFFAGDGDIVAAARAIMAKFRSEFRFDGGATGTDTPPAAAFAARHGVCQDFAHILIIAARAWGLPAAYVSGYLRTLPPPGQPRLAGADAMHAWVNLWCGPQLGWIGFDPTNDMIAGTDHIFVAMGRDYADVAPMDGVFHGTAGQAIEVAVDVVPID